MGIPEYRLPRDILDTQINYIKDMGVDFRAGVTIGKDLTIQEVRESGYKFPNYNPFVSHLARAIELVHDIDESIELIDNIPFKKEKSSIFCKAGFGAAITEAPRGSLYHSYELDNNGVVKKADIVPPTSHNAYNIEKDLHKLIEIIQDLPIEEITLKCEMLIRAYDPCISCSAH